MSGNSQSCRRRYTAYQGNSHKAFHGLALVIVQPTGTAGTVSLSASSRSLAPAQIGIEVG
jgi:hypothetical protein